MDNKYISDMVEGVRVGLMAFLMCFGLAVVLGIIVNYAFLDEINAVMNGSLSSEPTPTVSSLLLIVSIVMNLCVFNNGGMLENGGSLHIGLLILVAVPVIAFIVADRRDNKKKRFSMEDMVIYLTSSAVFSLVLYLFSLIARGELLYMDVDYSNPMNIIMTVVIVMCIQFFIGLNYNKHFSPGIKMTRVVLRTLLGLGLLMGAAGIIYGVTTYAGGVLLTVGAIVVLLPNAAVYIMFTFMGASVEFGEQLTKLMAQMGVDVSFATFPLLYRMTFVAVFFGLVISTLWRQQSGTYKDYFKELGLFALSFSTVSLILAYSTKMNLGFVKNLLDVQFGISFGYAFFMPFTVIVIAGLLLQAIRYMIRVLIEG